KARKECKGRVGFVEFGGRVFGMRGCNVFAMAHEARVWPPRLWPYPWHPAPRCGLGLFGDEVGIGGEGEEGVGEEGGGVGEVLAGDGFDGGVHVAAGEAEEGGGDSAAGDLDGVGVGAGGAWGG